MTVVLRKITEIILFLIPASMLWLDSGASGGSAILFLVSLIGLVVIQGNKLEFDRHEKILVVLFIIFPLYSMISWWWHGMEDSGISQVARQPRFMLIIPVYFWLRRIEPPSALMRYGIITGAVIFIAGRDVPGICRWITTCRLYSQPDPVR